MPMERMPMRRVRDCVRLKNAGISLREIACRVGVASSTVRLTLQRCEAAGIAWPLAADLTDTVLEQRLFANAGVKPGHRRHEHSHARGADHGYRLNTAEAAQFVGLSSSTLAKLRVFGGGPNFYKLARRVVYDTRDLEAFLQSRSRTSTSDVGAAS